MERPEPTRTPDRDGDEWVTSISGVGGVVGHGEGVQEDFEMPLASATEMRHFAGMSMITLTPTAARGNLSELLRRALKGDDIGIVVDGKIVALRPVTVESTDYALREYGATAAELHQFEQRTHGQIEKARKEGKLLDFTGGIEALLEGKGQ
jgi:antitoxin (DNA-binding transcriptional repressor) of toxin-antitoxin stability system